MINLPSIAEASSFTGLLRHLGRWRDLLTNALRLPAVADRGVLLEGVSLTTTATPINHKLGAAPAGWLVLRYRGASAASVVETASDTRTLTLLASAAVSVDLWVWP